MARPGPLANNVLRPPMNEHGVLLHVISLQDMPIPVALFLYAAANVVVLSFVPAALFSGDRRASGADAYPRVRAPWLLPVVRSRALRAAGGAAGVLGLVVFVAAGLLGPQRPAASSSQYLVWIWLWAVLVPASALAGNLWPLVNPWAAIFDGAAPLLARLHRRALPPRLGIWPAAAVYLAFAFVELGSGSVRPATLALLAVGYTVLTLAGMTLCGRDEWLERCEALTVLLGVVGRFGPVEVARDADGRGQEVWLRPWGTGLLRRQRAGWDWIVLVVLLLSTLAFDGLAVTAPWQAVASALGAVAAPLGLLGLALAFLVVLVVFVRLVLAIGGAGPDDLGAATAFALTLVPIALLYHTALSWGFVVEGLRTTLPIRTDAIWYVQLTLVVLGHAIAVYLANLRAGERFRTTRRAMLGQYPMVVLLVLYTMASMWILAQPTSALQ